MVSVEVEERSGGIFVLWLNCGLENRLTEAVLLALARALRAALEAGARAVVTASRSRFWSNGVDLSSAPGPALAALSDVVALLLGCGCPTVACLNGHAVGGGFMLALAHDYRVAPRNSRSQFFVPAVSLGIVLPADLVRLARTKLLPGAVVAVMLGGERFRADAAKEIGFVTELCDGEDGVSEACEFARKVARDVGQRGVYAATKNMLFLGDGVSKL